mgnify:FL=1
MRFAQVHNFLGHLVAVQAQARAFQVMQLGLMFFLLLFPHVLRSSRHLVGFVEGDITSSKMLCVRHVAVSFHLSYYLGTKTHDKP